MFVCVFVEVCAGRGVETLHFPDNNCKTYWNCTGSPHPVCCKDGWSYDKFTGRCVVNVSCTDPCPKDYQGKFPRTIEPPYGKKVQAGKGQEKAQSEKDSHSKNRGGKKPNQQPGTYTMKHTASRMSRHPANRRPLSYLN